MKNIFEQRVFYSDTDSYGVVWHGSYLRWLEMGRVYWTEMKGLSLIDLVENQGYCTSCDKFECEV